MNILHITPSYSPAWGYGGPTLSVSRLCESQKALAEVAQVRVLTTTANGQKELEVEARQLQERNGVEVMYFKRWTGDHSHFSPSLLLELWRIARDYNVVHVHSWWNLVVIPAVFICWLRGVKPILSPRGMLSIYGQENSKASVKHLFQKLIGTFLLRQTILHGTAKQEISEGQQIIPNWSHFKAPNIIDLPAKPKIATNKEGRNVLQLVFLSRIHHKKGLDVLFKALASIEFPWTLKIVGSGKQVSIKELQVLANQLGISGHLQWSGWLSGEQKYLALQSADLFVLTSRNENFANVVLEALAVGTPVLLSTNVGMAEYVLEKDLGWVCPLDVQQISKKLEQIYREKNRLNSLGQKAVDLIRVDFAADMIAKQYIRNYEAFLNG